MRDRLGSGGRLLVTRLRHVGDVILTLPLVAALRRAFPAAEIHYLAESGPLEVLGAQPEIDALWVSSRGAAATLALGFRLRAQRYAAALDLFSNPRSALLVRLSGAPLRVGEARRGRRRLYNAPRRLVPGRSALEQHLDALRSLGLEPPPPSRPVLHLRSDELASGRERWRNLETHTTTPHGPRILLHLGASQPTKEWPLQHAAELARGLAACGARVVLGTAPLRPGPGRELAAELGNALPVLPPLPLREHCGVLAAADAVVSVDGAALHAAVALGTPTLALFGPTDPRVWFPYEAFGPFRVLHAGLDCSRCDRARCPTRACMSALHAAQALAEVRALVQRSPRASRATWP